MKASDLRGQSKSDIVRTLAQQEDRLRSLRFSIAANQVKHVREVRHLRRDIARIKLVLAEKDREPIK